MKHLKKNQDHTLLLQNERGVYTGVLSESDILSHYATSKKKRSVPHDKSGLIEFCILERDQCQDHRLNVITRTGDCIVCQKSNRAITLF